MNAKRYEPESEWFIANTICTPGDHNIYVDLGAAHPTNKSLTHLLRDLGWRGLAVDANPDYRADWEAAGFGDHFVCAVLSDASTVRFCTHENAFTSRISDFPEGDKPEKWGIKRITVEPARQINDLLNEHRIEKIDLLSIDLEGHEFAVLKTLDFERHSPAFIIAEFVTAGEGTDPRVCNFLLSKGYEVVFMSESNLIYRRK